ncbi:MAG: class I SAM-dependent methyltransferase [bacterium]
MINYKLSRNIVYIVIFCYNLSTGSHYYGLFKIKVLISMEKGSKNLFRNEHGNIYSSLKYIESLNIHNKNKIIDIGCRYGSLLYNLYRKGYNDIYGIDKNIKTISEGKIKYNSISERLMHYKGNEIPFDDNSFDVILMFDVIEHIPNINRFISDQVYRILKPGGIFIFQTPNKFINVPWSIIATKSFTKYKKWHCSLQNYFSLKKLLKEAKFNNVIIEKYNIITKHNKNKVRDRFGSIGVFFLKLASKLPLYLYPNFWGNCKK